MDIHVLHKQGLSIREIARESGYSRNTVRKMLRGHAPPKFKKVRRSKTIEPFGDYLRQRYLECGLSAVRLLEEIQAQGFVGSIHMVRRYLEDLRPLREAAAKATVRFETPPGQQAQVDWGYCGQFPDAAGKLVKVYVFVMVLSFSRMLFVRFTTSMKLPVLIEAHQRAFDYFGGWPEVILYDNMKQVRLDQQTWNPAFLDFAGHYGFAPQTCRVRRARTKGKVERMVQYVKDNFLNGRSFADLEDLNAQATGWLNATANARLHSTTGHVPAELLGEEKLIALASIRPYRLSSSLTRTVNNEAMVRVERSRYSVPPAYVGKSVTVSTQEHRIEIRCGDVVIAEHEQAVRPGSCVSKPEHLAELWKLCLQDAAKPLPNWQLHFQQSVASTPLERYDQAAAGREVAA
jgi:transposase